MIKNLPSKIYLDPKSFFEAEMGKIQKEVDALREMDPVYRAVYNALESTEKNYPQKFKVERYGTSLYVRTILLPDQHYSVFRPLVSEIAKELVYFKLRDTSAELPNPVLDYMASWSISAKTKDKRYSINVQLSVSDHDGNIYRDMRIEKKTRAYEDYVYTWQTDPNMAGLADRPAPKKKMLLEPFYPIYKIKPGA